MAKTSKEKVQAFRAKLSDVKKKEIREKDRLHKASERSKRSKKQIAIDREKARISMRKLRALRKSQVKQSEVPNNGDPEEISSPSKTAYGSNLSLYKAVSRAKLALPKSPRKKKAVVRKLAKSFGIAEDKNKVIRGTPALINEAKERVIEFYQRDDISCMTPGRKDFINVTNDDGTKSKVQRRYLLYSIRECFELFQADNVGENAVKVGKSKFFELRPKFSLPIGKTPYKCMSLHVSREHGIACKCFKKILSRSFTYYGFHGL